MPPDGKVVTELLKSLEWVEEEALSMLHEAVSKFVRVGLTEGNYAMMADRLDVSVDRVKSSVLAILRLAIMVKGGIKGGLESHAEHFPLVASLLPVVTELSEDASVEKLGKDISHSMIASNYVQSQFRIDVEVANRFVDRPRPVASCRWFLETTDGKNELRISPQALEKFSKQLDEAVHAAYQCLRKK